MMYKWLDQDACVTTNDGTFVALKDLQETTVINGVKENYELIEGEAHRKEEAQLTKGVRVMFKSGRAITIPNTARLLGVLEKHWARKLEVGMPIAMVDEVWELTEEELHMSTEQIEAAVEELLESGNIPSYFRSVSGRRLILAELIRSRGWLYGNRWAKSQHHIEYAMTTPRPHVARQIQQLFLQFGMHAIVRVRHVNKHIRYIVSVHGTHEMQVLFDQFDQQLRDKKNYDTVKSLVSIMRPIEVYPIELSQKIEEVRKARGVKSASMVIKETGNERYRPKTTHRREHLVHFAKVLDMDELADIANAPIRYDRIVSIEKVKFEGMEVEMQAGHIVMNGVVVC